jgi:glycosyltransferase involved in cell wall biosynthesis
MTTLISHIYNEEYLLPYFIDRHYDKFENGIIVDFGSTDRSREILAAKAPKWKVMDSPIEEFQAKSLDELITNIEADIEGIRIVLTAAEFLIGNPRFVKSQEIIPTISLIALPGDLTFQKGRPFHEQCTWGIPAREPVIEIRSEWLSRHPGRSIHDHRIEYPLGRHYQLRGESNLLIYRVSNCLISDEMIKRRLQIQTKIPDSDIRAGRGWQHTAGEKLDEATLLDIVRYEKLAARSLAGEISSALWYERVATTHQEGSDVWKLLEMAGASNSKSQSIFSDWRERFQTVFDELHSSENRNRDQESRIDEILREKQELIRVVQSIKVSFESQSILLSDWRERFQTVSDELHSSETRNIGQEVRISELVREKEELARAVESLAASLKRPSVSLRNFLKYLVPAVRSRFRWS